MSFRIDPCAKALMKVLNMSFVSRDISLRLIESWGDGAGDLGEYDDCSIIQEDPSLKLSGEHVNYCWVGSTVNSAIGLCVPNICARKNALVSQFELLANILHVPIVPGVNNATSLQTQCSTENSELSMEGKLVIVTLIILFALVIFASVDAWKVELGRLLRRGWDCFDIKAQEDAGEFIDSAAPSPVQSRYRRAYNNNNIGDRASRSNVRNHQARKPNQHQSDTDGEGQISDNDHLYGFNNSGNNNRNVNSHEEHGGFCATILQTFSLRSNYNQLFLGIYGL